MADATEETYTVKEVISDLKTDLVGRFDKVDHRLESIDRRVDTTATKEDIREVHQRIDGLETDHGHRIQKLEDHHSEVEAVNGHKRRLWAVAGAAALIVATVGAALIAALVH